MEGEFCNLPEVVALKKKYGAYVYLDEAYLDEAHSDQRVAGRWLEHACRVLVEPVYKWSMAHWSCRSPAGRGENRTVSRGSMTHAPLMDMRGRVVLKTKSSGRAQVFLCSITNNSSNYYSTLNKIRRHLQLFPAFNSPSSYSVP